MLRGSGAGASGSSFRWSVLRSIPRIAAASLLLPFTELTMPRMYWCSSSSSFRASRHDFLELERTLIAAFDFRRKVGKSNPVVTAKDHRVLDGVVQLTDVSGPRISQQALHRFGLDVGSGFPASLLTRARKCRSRMGVSSGALAQRRDVQRHRRDPVVEIRSETALRDRVIEPGIGGRDDSHVNGDFIGRTHRSHPLAFDRPEQLGLRRDRHFADFVQEDASLGRRPEKDRRGPGARR